jgi:hypothetical protein
MSKKRQANSPIVGKDKARKEDMSDTGSVNGEGNFSGMS